MNQILSQRLIVPFMRRFAYDKVNASKEMKQFKKDRQRWFEKQMKIYNTTNRKGLNK